jgi:hypothetical protein
MYTKKCVPRILALALALAIVMLALSCGGNMGAGLHRTDGSNAGSLADGAYKSAGLIRAVPESEIGALPAWQQKLLSDPGWNQPYITPPAGTLVAAPSLASLGAETTRAMARGVKLNPRFAQSAAKGASWTGDHAGPFNPSIATAEYETLAPNADPPFGCNNDAGNSANGHAIEDLINATAAASPALPTYAVSYVREGLCAANYFNTLAGANKNASAAVYQAYCSVNDASYDPANPPVSAEVAEISYRSSLVPAGNPGPPSNCAATAYLVADYFWRAFNSQLSSDQIPGGPVDVYNVLIAPSGAASADAVSSGETTGAYQPFYFGSVSACYGGAWIIGLTASDSACLVFKDYFEAGLYQPAYWYRPVYGVILQRWLDMAPVDGQPWLSELGWPVLGPVGYDNGAMQINDKGAYYQWGMWFEKGFIWWLDYDQNTNPTVPDEAQTYYYTGSNVYCDESGDELVKASPAQFYGGSGPLGVNVTVDGVRQAVTDPWAPARLNATGKEYHIALSDPDGLSTVQLLMHARGYGGQPNADCKYKTYVWAFRDGTVQPAGSDYDETQRKAVHIFGDLARNKESVYIVRVQVQDEVGFAYGDSLPIVLGHTPGAVVGSEILVIRDDAPDFNTYNVNFNALTTDLDAIGAIYTVVNFTPTIAADFVAGGYKAAIWYRGGPGDASEPIYTVAWTTDEETAFRTLLGHKMLLISQAHGSVETIYPYSYWGWDNYQDSQFCQRVNSVLMTHTTDQKMGLTSNETNGNFNWLYVMFGSEMGTGGTATKGPQTLGLPQAWGSNAAERNTFYGSSGKMPEKLSWSTGGSDVLQFCTRGWYPPFGSNWTNPGWTCGMSANPSGSGSWLDCPGTDTFLSYGNTSSGGAEWNEPGPGRFWCWGMPYAKLAVTESTPEGMSRADVLQNVMAWLDQTLTLDIPGDDNWRPYAGEAEIISVTPGYWETSPPGFIKDSVSVTGVDYPDATSTDAYRTGYTNAPGERYISTSTAGNNGLDCADLDFQFPWYAYITTNTGDVETSPDTTTVPPALTTDDTVVFKGLLVSDADQNWTRYTPPTGELPNVMLNYGQPLPVVAGYFTSVAGDTNDEVYSNYGAAAPALTWNNTYKLEVEAIAHWSQYVRYGTKPARLCWSMFPGHRMYYPGSSTFLTDTTDGWLSFRKLFDIDPTVNPAGRNATSWNAAQFQFSNCTSEGRVVAFNYHNIPDWNPDLNYDGDANAAADGPADKFPIRCRLFTDYASYIDSNHVANGIQPYIWPDNQPPATTYVEGGCYVVDSGAPAFPFRILDDPLQPDPQECVTGGAGNYEITFNYILKYGVAPYTSVMVEFDPVFNHKWGNDGSYVYTLATGIATGGAQTNVLTLDGTPDHVAPPAGSYWITLRGIDGDTPPVTDYWRYTGSQLVLMP